MKKLFYKSFTAIISCFLIADAHAVLMTYTDETSFLNAVSLGGYDLVSENISGPAWAGALSGPVASVTSQGITWTANDGVDASGGWGPNTVYDHFGDPDALMGVNSIDTLFGIGGYFSRTSSDLVNVFLDGSVAANFTPVSWSDFAFFGVIDTEGFNSFRFASTVGHWGLRNISMARGSGSVPEPTTLALMVLGLAGIGYKRKLAA